MNIASATTASSADVYASLNGKSSTTAADQGAGSADRFLKLLVAQMENQDPLNPMDNAEVTTQMAQINTVEGVNRLNTTVMGLNAQFTQLQAMQGASLIGHSVSLNGNQLAMETDGQIVVGRGGFDLSGPADMVRVEVLNPAGRVVGTETLGAKTSGRHDFDFDATGVALDGPLTFRVLATRGAASVSAQPLMLERVSSVSAGAEKLQLTLENGSTIDYADVIAVHRGG